MTGPSSVLFYTADWYKSVFLEIGGVGEVGVFIYANYIS